MVCGFAEALAGAHAKARVDADVHGGAVRGVAALRRGQTEECLFLPICARSKVGSGVAWDDRSWAEGTSWAGHHRSWTEPSRIREHGPAARHGSASHNFHDVFHRLSCGFSLRFLGFFSDAHHIRSHGTRHVSRARSSICGQIDSDVNSREAVWTITIVEFIAIHFHIPTTVSVSVALSLVSYGNAHVSPAD